jgi:hypothetical protein
LNEPNSNSQQGFGINNTLGASSGAYQSHLAAQGRDGFTLNKLEKGNNAATIVGLGLLVVAPPVGATVLTTTLVGGIGIDSLQLATDRSDENLRNLIYNAGLSFVGLKAGTAFRSLEPTFSRLPNAGRAYVVNKTGMNTFLSNTTVRNRGLQAQGLVGGISTTSVVLAQQYGPQLSMYQCH